MLFLIVGCEPYDWEAESYYTKALTGEDVVVYQPYDPTLGGLIFNGWVVYGGVAYVEDLTTGVTNTYNLFDTFHDQTSLRYYGPEYEFEKIYHSTGSSPTTWEFIKGEEGYDYFLLNGTTLFSLFITGGNISIGELGSDSQIGGSGIPLNIRYGAENIIIVRLHEEDFSTYHQITKFPLCVDMGGCYDTDEFGGRIYDYKSVIELELHIKN